MIQPLRTVHRRAFFALAVVLPVILAVGLGARRTRTQFAPSTDESSNYPLTKPDKLWQKHAIQTELYRNASHPQEIDVVLKPVQELNEPDLLLYWAADEPQGNTLPVSARLLGAFHAGRAFALPQDATQDGHLVLYSGAHLAVVDTVPVEKLP